MGPGAFRNTRSMAIMFRCDLSTWNSFPARFPRATVVFRHRFADDNSKQLPDQYPAKMPVN